MIHFIGNSIYEDVRINNATLKQCLEYCLTKKVLGIDIETSRKFSRNRYTSKVYKPGLDPYLSKVVMLQIGDVDNIFVIDTRVIDPTPLKTLLDKDIVFVGHYLKFEMMHLKYNYNFVFSKNKVNTWDTMLAEINLHNGLPLNYSLEGLAKRYLGIKSVKDFDLFKIDNKDYFTNELDDTQIHNEIINKNTRLGFLNIGDKPFTINQIIYGADDIVLPLKIYQEQRKGRVVQGERYNPKKLHALENEYQAVLADTEMNGIPLDVQAWMRLHDESMKRRLHLQEILDSYVCHNHPKYATTTNLFTSLPTCSIEWTSPSQVVTFFRDLDICPMEFSSRKKRKEYTVASKVLLRQLPNDYKERYSKNKDLDQIKSNEDLILMYLLYKRAQQATTTFGKDFLKNIHPITGRVHPNFYQILYTGRTSSSPNTQNWPSDERYRNCVRPKNGWKFNIADYSGQELRIAADKSGDSSMIKFFNDGDPFFGDDFHSYVATKMFRIIDNDPNLVITKESHPKKRSDAKNLNFKIIYGGSAYTLKYDFDVEEEEAEEFIQSYYDVLPGLKSYFDKVEKNIEYNNYIKIDSVLDRRWFNPFFREMQSYKEEALSFYPSNYETLSYYEKQQVKEQLNEDHPEIRKYWSKYFKIRNKIARLARNYPIQGTAGSMTKLAGVLLRREIIKNNIQDKLKIINFVHDEIKTEFKDFERAPGILEDCMVKAGNYLASIKIIAHAVVADKWVH